MSRRAARSLLVAITSFRPRGDDAGSCRCRPAGRDAHPDGHADVNGDADHEPDPTSSPTPTDQATASPSPAVTRTPSASPTAEPSRTVEPTPTETAKAKAAPRVGVAPQLVPPPATENDAVITVKVGGDRFSVSGVRSLAGVVLGFYDAATGGSPVFTCTSDADGDCSITVGDTQTGGANRDHRYWVRQISAPSGWYTSATLRTGQSTAAGTEATPYRFQTGSVLQAGHTYTSTADFMEDTGSNNRSASGGFWQNSRTNPVLPSTCGLRVGLVLDLSGSTSGALPQLKQAANTFVDSLVGTPSSMSLFSFSYDSPADGATQNFPTLTPVSTQGQADAFKARYANWSAGGGTNWDRGLAVAAEAANRFDVVVVITDGSPTNYGSPRQGSGSFNRIREVENGIFSANAIKAEGARVLGFGVGDAITADPNAGLNLRAVSGPTEYNGSNTDAADFYRTADYAAAGAALKALAQGNCLGSITVVKQIVPSTAAPGSIAGATPAGGWDMAAAGSPGVSVDPPTSRTTADGTGAVNFPLTFTGGTTTGPITVTETQQPGFTIQPVAGANAVCVRSDTGASIPVTNSGALGFQVDAATSYPVSCTIYNRAPSPEASVVLDKTWIVDGTTYAEGQQPAGLDAVGRIDGTSQGWGVPRTGFSQGDTVELDETATIVGRPFCEITSRRLTGDNGTTVDRPLPDSVVLNNPTNRYEITNVVTCTQRLTLVKQVANGSGDPSAWDLRATAPTGALPGPQRNHRHRSGDRRRDGRRHVHARRVGRAASPTSREPVRIRRADSRVDGQLGLRGGRAGRHDGDPWFQ